MGSFECALWARDRESLRGRRGAYATSCLGLEGTAASTQPWRFLGVDPEIYIFEVASGVFLGFCFLVSDVLAEARTGVESRHGIDRHL